MENSNLVFNTGHMSDSVSPSEALINFNLIKEGYVFPIDDLSFDRADFELFIVELEKTYDIKMFDFSDSNRSRFRRYECEEFVIHSQGGVKDTWCSVNSKTIQVSEHVFSIYKTFYKATDEVKIHMTTFFHDGGRLQDSVRSLNKDDVKMVNTDYYPYIDTDVMFEQFLTLQENILIMTGRAGLGKSKMSTAILKYAAEHDDVLPYDKLKSHPDLEKQYVNVAYVKSTEVLADDNFWRVLSAREYDFVVLDDLDYMLTKRSAEIQSHDDQIRNKFLNEFLSFTDGIEKTKTKFIITTNQSTSDVDLALLRKGRLFDILELRELKIKEAYKIWEKSGLKEHEFHALYEGKDSILPADLGSEITKHLNPNRKSLKNYIKEDGISKMELSKKVKKIGFQ